MGPEETLQALSASVAAGAQVLELDVHGSADGVPVCIHDDTLDRTTSGAGSSVMTTGKPQRCRRQATPLAKSPAPRMSTR